MTPGRLVCDLKISSKELVQCKSYDLTELARTLLHKQRLELGPERLQNMYRSVSTLGAFPRGLVFRVPGH
ncbi:DNA polymerase alpha catalytic subunit, putative [Ixodes scapularis]|uniref:DNA polymerase alpha catalytic subunit, putative n=1 Tax=Ixodes scapularis TaxID=6945 RepID=B7PXA6_IXOSC|nr:DNA polymerase alpha catalytic subunit, putative [Ixodes scapularis]|eukprot:XP_002399797.1 DNA polymerase alpha catalytic subunit, putative [Ixodes scapularis]